MASGVQIDTLFSWANVCTPDALMKLGPLLATVATLMVATERCHHPLVLPGVLVAIPLLFHLVLLTMGWSLEQAQEAGWVMRPTVGGLRMLATGHQRLQGAVTGYRGWWVCRLTLIWCGVPYLAAHFWFTSAHQWTFLHTCP
jgi:hypothetical protein